MKTCLVTKLKGSVMGNLPIFGGARFFLHNTTGGLHTSATLIVGPSTTIRVISGNVFAYKASDWSPIHFEAELLTNTTTAIVAQNEAIVAIVNKEEQLSQIGFDDSSYSPSENDYIEYYIEDFAYMNTLNLYILPNYSRGLGTLKLSTISNIINIAFPIKGDYSYDFDGVSMDDLANMTVFTSLAKVPQGALKNFDISLFGKNSSIVNNNNTLALQWAERTDISGEVRTLLDALRTSGKRAGTIRIFVSGTNCTFDGKELTIADGSSNGWAIEAVYTDSGYTAVQKN